MRKTLEPPCPPMWLDALAHLDSPVSEDGLSVCDLVRSRDPRRCSAARTVHLVPGAFLRDSQRSGVLSRTPRHGFTRLFPCLVEGEVVFVPFHPNSRAGSR